MYGHIEIGDGSMGYNEIRSGDQWQLDGEEWENIIGFEDTHQISDFGRVRSIPRRLKDSGKGKSAIKGRIMKLGIDKDGYKWLILEHGNKKKAKRVHHLVLEAFCGPCPPGMECRHLDNDRGNNHLNNLRWGTKKENQADRLKYGTDMRGEKHFGSRLTEQDVIEIRRLYATGEYLTWELANKFGVRKVTVEAAIRGRTWSYLPGAVIGRFGNGTKRRKEVMLRRAVSAS